MSNKTSFLLVTEIETGWNISWSSNPQIILLKCDRLGIIVAVSVQNAHADAKID